MPSWWRGRGGPTSPGRWLSLRHDGPHGSRQYDLYLPAGLSPRAKAPLLLLLHGCRQRSMDFAKASGFTAAADADGFVIAAPRQEMRHQIQSCWRWYDSGHQQRGAGEPALLRDIVGELLTAHSEWRIDPQRVYAAGLSAGGAMSLILATTYPDVFAAVGVHSATAYGSATQGFSALNAMAARGRAPAAGGITSEMAPVVLIHGSADQVVRPPNGDRIVDQWLGSRAGGRVAGLNRIRPLATTRALLLGGRHCTRTRWYTTSGRRVLEYWRIDGLGHAWSGGTASGSFIDRSGPRATEVMWNFFSRHRLTGGRSESPGVHPAELADGVVVEHDYGWPAPTF